MGNKDEIDVCYKKAEDRNGHDRSATMPVRKLELYERKERREKRHLTELQNPVVIQLRTPFNAISTVGF